MLRTIFDDLLDINREMNRIFSGYRHSERDNWAEANVYENNEGYVIVAKLPGVSREDTDISIKDNSLKISGERKVTGIKDASVHLKERFSGKFERNFILNEKIDTDKIQAEMKNGLLMIKLPKSPETKPRKIEIK